MSFISTTSHHAAFRVLFEHHNAVAVEALFIPVTKRTHATERRTTSGFETPTNSECARSLWTAVSNLVEIHADSVPLQLVQAIGDTCLIAGPFAPVSDSELRALAEIALQIMRDLANVAEEHGCRMIAAADVDWAFGALIGTKHKSYTVLGPVTNSVRAIVAAAPDLTIGTVGSAAYSTAHFAAYCAPPLFDFSSERPVYLGTEAMIPPHFSLPMSWSVRHVGRLRVMSIDLNPEEPDFDGFFAQDDEDAWLTSQQLDGGMCLT